jgi:hypothetical protein
MGPERRATAACAVALFAASFLARVPLARAWHALGVIGQHDVLFDADPVVFQQAFADGDMRDRLWRTHPNVRNLVNPPVRAVAGLARLVRPAWSDERARAEAALLVAPAAAGVTTAAVFLTLRVLGGSILAALLGALVEACAFSGLVFGSIPESYPVSGAMLALAFLLLAETARTGGRIRAVPWILVASTAFGITATNLVLVGIPLFFAASHAKASRLRGAAVTLAVLLAAAAVGTLELLALNAAYAEHLPRRKIERTDSFLGARPLDTLRSFPDAVVSTVLTDRPAVVTNEIGLRRDYPWKLMFTIEGGPRSVLSRLLRGLVVAGFLLLGAVQLARRPGTGPAVLWAALGVLAFNLVLHSFYRGPDLLLYSMHWHAAVAVVLGAAALGPRPAAVALLALAVAFNSATVLLWMLRTLRALA